MSAFPEIQSGYDYGNDLLADNQLSDEDRDKIEKEMNNIGEDFKALQKDINAEQDRSAISFLTSVFRFWSPTAISFVHCSLFRAYVSSSVRLFLNLLIVACSFVHACFCLNIRCFCKVFVRFLVHSFFHSLVNRS